MFAFATHGIFNEGFYNGLHESVIDCVYTTDSLAARDEAAEKAAKVRRMSLAPLIDDFIAKRFGSRIG